MNSGYPAEVIRGGGGRGRGAGIRPGNMNQAGYGEQQHLQFPQQQHYREDVMFEDEIAQGGVELLMGKRSFVDYHSYQQQQHQLSYLHPSLLRSVKQRPNNYNIIPLSSYYSLPRSALPVYSHHHQLPLFHNQSSTQLSHSINNNNSNSLMSHSNNTSQMGINSGWNAGSGDSKILNTLEELEKHLLDDDDFGVPNEPDGDALSGITNSEWSATILNLTSPNPNPIPIPNPNPTIIIINNNVISPSPTSSTSSCCSPSAPATSSTPLRTATTTTTTTTAVGTASSKELITEAAAAISDGKNDSAMELISTLERISNKNGNSEERLSYYMCNALKSRACTTPENQKPIDELFGTEQMSAIYSLYDISPCFKFGLLAANLVMLEAITSAMQEGKNIQIIDFDIGHGAQYVNLLRALAERKTRSPCTGMRITVVDTELSCSGGVPENVKGGLVALAERVGIYLKYESVTRPIHELTWESLGCVVGEAVMVNFAFKLYRVPDESVSMENLRDELLRRVKGIAPRAVTLVEQDMNGNTAPFVTRVNEARAYYGALFDSFEATLPRDKPDRCRVEKGLGRKMVNSVAFEGRKRLERAEVFGKWRARMGMAGFELKAISQSVAESIRVKLNSGRGGNPGFTVKEECGGVRFGWLGRSLIVASAWR